MGLPKPVVQANQLFLVISVLCGLVISPWILLLPLLHGIISLLFKYNLVMEVTMKLLTSPKEEYPQEDPAQQRFNQWISTVLVGLSLLAFLLSIDTLGYIFGSMVILAVLIALLGFCIGCWIRFKYIMWRHEWRNRKR